MRYKLKIILLVFVLTHCCFAKILAQSSENVAEAPWKQAETIKNEEWKGFSVKSFPLESFNIQVAFPDNFSETKPWTFLIGVLDGYHIEMNEKLLKSGVAVVAVNIFNVFGSEYGLKLMDQVYDIVRVEYGFSQKCCLYGVSRAGLSVYNWARRHPERVACIYCEGPVLDFKTWPMSWKPSAKHWKDLKKLYNFSSDEEAVAYKGNPIDNLKPIADANIPVRHVISLTSKHDTQTVPNDKNTLKAQRIFKELGHTIDIAIIPDGQLKPPDPFDDESVSFIVRWCK